VAAVRSFVKCLWKQNDHTEAGTLLKQYLNPAVARCTTTEEVGIPVLRESLGQLLIEDVIAELKYLTTARASGIIDTVVKLEGESDFQLWEENDRLRKQQYQLEKEKAQLTEENRRLRRELLKKQGSVLEKQTLEETVSKLSEQLCEQQRQQEESQRDTVALRQQIERLNASAEQQKRLMAQTKEEADRLLWEYDRMLFIPSDQLQLSNLVLGCGSFGEVKAGVWRGCSVAIKTFYRKVVTISERNIQLVRREIAICGSVHHPNLVSICGATTEREVPLSLVMELEEGSLGEVMDASYATTRYLTLREQVDLAIGCLSGIAYLHQLQPRSLLHGDIRPTNVLVSRTMVARIGDLGSTHFAGSALSFGPVSRDYVAPERVPSPGTDAVSNTAESDIYSLGVTLAELFSGVQASYVLRQKQLLAVSPLLLQEVCCHMAAENPAVRMPAHLALPMVESFRSDEDYRSCPPKRLVKGKTHGVEDVQLVTNPWD
jgi:mitogen-activated protein kinase kinase kinase 7